MVNEIDKLRKNKDIKLLFYVLARQVVVHLHQNKYGKLLPEEEKPVVVSMGDVAASVDIILHVMLIKLLLNQHYYWID